MRRQAQLLVLVGLAIAAFAAIAPPAFAHLREDEPEYRDLTGLAKEWQVGPYAPTAGARRVTRPADVPDIFGPGAVLTVGNVFMKCTNYGLDGNPFTQYSSDPSAQWPGASGTEYLNYIGLAVGAVNPFATDPTAVRRVSYITEWRPPTLDPVDRMYRCYDGIVNGQRFVDDDNDMGAHPNDPQDYIDEDFLDGRDNDGDGRIDEDYGAIGQEMFTCVMRDDTPQAINAAATERHVPLGLECRHACWAYSIPGYTDFNVLQYDIYNVSGHELDSVFVGFRSDMDCGPVTQQNYWADDFNLPQYPHGDFMVKTADSDWRLQPASDRAPDFSSHDRSAPSDSALCPRFKLRVIGWSTCDDNGDDGKTPGVPSVMLIDHSIDPTGLNAPSQVGLRSFRSFINGTPYANGGSPTIDQQRYELISSTEGVDPGANTSVMPNGFIDPKVVTGENKGDYSDWSSVGPWLKMPASGPDSHIQVTLAFGVSLGSFQLCTKYANDYNKYVTPVQDFEGNDLGTAVTDATNLMAKYPSLVNALAAKIAFEGSYDDKIAYPLLNDVSLINPASPPYHGRETPIKAPTGEILTFSDGNVNVPCPRSENSPARSVNDRQYSWFDFDCDYCTGAYSGQLLKRGIFHHTWLAETPPPSPNTNLNTNYNYTDNPGRQFIAAGDHSVSLAWDNLSEVTPDPKSGQFDFRGYVVWKVSNWQRPVGSSGPYEDDWTQMRDFRLFDRDSTNALRYPCPAESVFTGPQSDPRYYQYPCHAASDTLWPWIYIPQTRSYKHIKLYRGDLWDRQSGDVLRPDFNVPCKGYPGDCKTSPGLPLGATSGLINRIQYPVGRYHIVDTDVKNGFVYFYSVTAYDSTSGGMLSSRRSATEAEEVVPQSSVDTTSNGSKVWVVPNPYRGVKQINKRPSAWDLTPNATDPTGTHIDFFGLPRGSWKIKIFTVSGDLVAVLNADDPVNESIRSNVTGSDGISRPGVNRQQDNANDGQARWNLISRNGQDVVSGIYLFTVELGGSVKHRGKFVIIR